MNPTEKMNRALDYHLKMNDTLNITDLLKSMLWLHDSHLYQWQQSSDPLEILIQCGSKKWLNACSLFVEKVKDLDFVEAPWMSYSLIGDDKELRVCIDDNPEIEKLFCRHYFNKSITSRKKTNFIKKLTEKPELRVFIKTSSDSECDKCQKLIYQKNIMYSEANKAYCLKCVNLDTLTFLGSGDATLSRRARKNSHKFAAVVEFNKRRKRYERRGILVEQLAIDAAEMECNNDASTRAVSRAKSEVKRQEDDYDFTTEFTLQIKKYFPRCPHKEIIAIAQHATVRSSGRVGRTAAAKNFDEEMIRLAVIAYIRHQHTDYDRLLLNRTAKQIARKLIQAPLQRKLQSWE